MDSNEFRKAAHAVIDEGKWPLKFVAGFDGDVVINYYETIDDRRVLSNVAPGYLRKILPSGPPEEGERWDEIQKDIESKIMPGLTHWCVPMLKNLLKLRLPKAISKLYGLLPSQRYLSFDFGRSVLCSLYQPCL